jgi:hypothetical protein
MTAVSAGMSAPEPSAGTGSLAPLPDFDAGSDPNRNKVAPGTLCSRLAEIDCAGEVHCCNNPGRTVEACRADIMKTCTDNLFLDRMAGDPITGFDMAAAERAYTQLEEKAAQCDDTVAIWGGSPEGLRGILKGTVAPEAECTAPPEAIIDPPKVAAHLASCAQIATHACLPAQEEGGPWSCEARSTAGGPCFSDNNCVDGLYCNTANPMGACTERLADGTACTNPTSCKSLYCKKGSCVPADQQSAYCLRND